MRQSTIIFGVIVFAFIVYITLRGQLSGYLSLFTKGDGAEQIAGGNMGESLSKENGPSADKILEKANNMMLPQGNLGGEIIRNGIIISDILKGVF